MAANPKADWTLADVTKLVRQEGLEMRTPNGGSHNVVSSPHLRDSLCVPSHRPIKVRYIKELVGYTIAHRTSAEKDEDK